MARDLLGTNDYLTNNNGLSDIDIDAFTIVSFLNADALVDAVDHFMNTASELTAGNNAASIVLQTPVASGFRLGFRYRWDSVAQWLADGDTSLMVDHHIAVTYDRSSDANVPTLFVDGLPVASSEVVAPSGTPKTGVDSVVFGSAASLGANDYNGKASESAIYAGILTTNEITALARGRLPFRVAAASLLHYWPIWGLHSPEIDLVSNAGLLTLNGSVPKVNHSPVTLFTPKWASNMPQLLAAGPAPVDGISLPPYGQVLFNSADEENRPRYGQRIARGTEE